MCARFTLYTEGRLIAERFLLAQIPDLVARYNIAPSQSLPVIATKANGTGRGLAMFRWGFIPHWATDDKGMRPVNAKSETISGSVMFGDSFRMRRCIVPGNGFYEWRTEGRNKLALHLRLKFRSLFAFVGIPRPFSLRSTHAANANGLMLGRIIGGNDSRPQPRWASSRPIYR